jgi:hypothetical protein
MSADNGIYIAEFSDGYRVCEATAIENLWYFPEGSSEEKQQWRDYFGNSRVFLLKEDAILYGHKLGEIILSSEFPILEYGVNYIGRGRDFL